jgi:phage RecT family recombinase
MTEVALREDIKSPVLAVVAAVREPEMKAQLQMMLPENVSVERFVRVATTALRENEVDLSKCERNSLLAAVFRCAQDNLLPDGHEAAIVRYGDTAQYLPMIGGLRKIAGEHGWMIDTATIHEHDEFDYQLGDEPTLVHRPARLLDDRGELIGAYAIGRHESGRRTPPEVMSRTEIEKVRASSRAGKSGPWTEWYERMAEKTVGRRLFAKLPLGDRERVTSVLEADEEIPGNPVVELYGPQATATLAAPASRATPGSEEAGERREANGGAGAQPHGPDAAEPPFVGEEPAGGDPIIEQAGLERFTAGRFEGRTVAEIAALGEEGRSYLTWAEGSWTDGRLKAALTTWNAATHNQQEKP